MTERIALTQDEALTLLEIAEMYIETSQALTNLTAEERRVRYECGVEPDSPKRVLHRWKAMQLQHVVERLKKLPWGG